MQQDEDDLSINDQENEKSEYSEVENHKVYNNY
jgi:hypothetical protein